MPDFDYSVAAKNVLNKFYNVDKMVYVEGEDDIPFWEFIFDKFAGCSVEVESVGGKPELIKVVKGIEDENAEYLVAMDSDFDIFKYSISHCKVIKTPGYSIENTLVTSESLAKIIKTLARIPAKDVPRGQCVEWLDKVNNVIKNLVILDVANEMGGHGLKVALESSDRFMISNASCDLCPEKIDEFIESIQLSVTEATISDIDKVINDLGLSYIDVVRGHFLLSASLRFIRTTVRTIGKNISISMDALYANMISVFENTFDESHPHFSHYKKSLASIKITA